MNGHDINIDQEFWDDFVQEAFEHLEDIEANVLTLEQNPQDTDIIHTMFRAYHTIKGLAGFVEHTIIQELAHKTETLMDLCRKGEKAVSTEIVDAILKSSDYIRRMCEDVDACKDDAFIAQVETLAEALEKLSDEGEGDQNQPQTSEEPPVEAPAEEPAEDSIEPQEGNEETAENPQNPEDLIPMGEFDTDEAKTSEPKISDEKLEELKKAYSSNENRKEEDENTDSSEEKAEKESAHKGQSVSDEKLEALKQAFAQGEDNSSDSAEEEKEESKDEFQGTSGNVSAERLEELKKAFASSDDSAEEEQKNEPENKPEKDSEQETQGTSGNVSQERLEALKQAFAAFCSTYRPYLS